MATATVNRADALIPIVEHQMDGFTFEGALEPFKQCIWALDSGDLARVVMQALNEFITTPALDVTDGIKQYFNGKGLSADLIQSLERLDCYVKKQTSHENTVALKKDVGDLAQEFSQHVQSTFQSYEDLIALAQQQEASGQIQQAVRSLYRASVQVLDDVGKLGPVVAKIKQLDPHMGNLNAQERINLSSQLVIIKLAGDLGEARQELDATKVRLANTESEIEGLKQQLVPLIATQQERQGQKERLRKITIRLWTRKLGKVFWKK